MKGLFLQTALTGIASAWLLPRQANTTATAVAASQCPQSSNAQLLHSATNKLFTIECGISHDAMNDTLNTVPAKDIHVCIGACARSKDCILIEYDVSQTLCTLKTKLGLPVFKDGNIAARLTPQLGQRVKDAALIGAPASTISVPGHPSSTLSTSYIATTTTQSTVTVTEPGPRPTDATAGEEPVTEYVTQTVVRYTTETRMHTATATQSQVWVTITSTALVTVEPSDVAAVPVPPTEAPELPFEPTPTAAPPPPPAMSSSTQSPPAAIGSPSTPAAPANSPATSKGKRGLLYEEARNTLPFGGANSKVTWTSNWNAHELLYSNQTSAPPGSYNAALEFIPQLWNASADLAALFASRMARLHSSAVLAFNEPNQCDFGGTCMKTPDKIPHVVQMYTQFIQSLAAQGLRLGSPSVTNGPDGISWLTSFFSLCSDCTVDFVQMHWYGGGMADFVPYVEKFFNTFKMPIWITEFGLDDREASAQRNEQFLRESMEYLDGKEWVERYAWFAAIPGKARALVGEDGRMTELGRIYNEG